MKKILKEASIWYILTVLGLSPILLLIMYITYTEKIIAPAIIISLLLAALSYAKLEE